MHYLHGVPMGRVCEQVGVELGALIKIFHRVAKLFSSIPIGLIEQSGQAPVRACGRDRMAQRWSSWLCLALCHREDQYLFVPGNALFHGTPKKVLRERSHCRALWWSIATLLTTKPLVPCSIAMPICSEPCRIWKRIFLKIKKSKTSSPPWRLC